MKIVNIIKNKNARILYLINSFVWYTNVDTDKMSNSLQIIQRAIERSLIGINKKDKVKQKVMRQRTQTIDSIRISRRIMSQLQKS